MEAQKATTPAVPALVEVTRSAGRVCVKIDGQEFPWPTVGGVDTAVRRDGLPSITLTIPAARLIVVDDPAA